MVDDFAILSVWGGSLLRRSVSGAIIDVSGVWKFGTTSTGTFISTVFKEDCAGLTKPAMDSFDVIVIRIEVSDGATE